MPDNTQRIKEYTAHRAHFSQALPGLQIAWDSTSLGAFKHCPREYYYSMIESWRPKHEATPLTFGIGYHAALEMYDRAKFGGADHEEAVLAAIREALSCGKYWMQYNCTVCGGMRYEHIVGEEDTPVSFAPCGNCGADQCNSVKLFKPWISDDSKRNRETLVRTVAWYLEQFKDDPAKTVMLDNGKPAVELSFRMQTELRNTYGEPYLLCGHLDRVVEFAGGEYVMDRKTTTTTLSSEYFERYSPDNQMSLYTLAGHIVFARPVRGVIIDGAQVAVGFTRFQRGFVNRTKAQVEEWLEDLSCWFRLAQEYAERQYWPMNDKSCFLCNYKNICRKDPAVRKNFLATEYIRVEWNPLTSRGEK